MANEPLTTEEVAELDVLMAERTVATGPYRHGGDHGGHRNCRACDLLARRVRQRPFPIQKSAAVPWSVAEEAYRVYAESYGTSQTLERLAGEVAEKTAGFAGRVALVGVRTRGVPLSQRLARRGHGGARQPPRRRGAHAG